MSTLERLGCYAGKAKKGSHLSIHRDKLDGHTLTSVLVLGRRQVPKGTLKSILVGLDIPLEEFLTHLR